MARRSLEDIGAAFRAEYQKEEQKVQAEVSNVLEAEDSSPITGQEIKENLTSTEKAIGRELESKAEDIKRVASKEQEEKQGLETKPSKDDGLVEATAKKDDLATTKATDKVSTTTAKVDVTAEKKLSKGTIKEKTEIAKHELEEEMRKEEEKERKKGVKLSRISDIIFYGSLVLMLVCVIFYTRESTGDRSSEVHKVTTTSMESVYPKDSLVSIKAVDSRDIAVGDDIAFSRNSGNLMIQRVLEILENHNDTGEPLFITGTLDSEEGSREAVSPNEIAGKVTAQVSKMNVLVAWIAGNPWIVMVIFLGLMALSFYIKMLGKRKITQGKNPEKKADKGKKRKEI